MSQGTSHVALPCIVVRPDGIIESAYGGADVSWVSRDLRAVAELPSVVSEAYERLASEPPGLLRRAVVAFEDHHLEILLLEALPLRRSHTRLSELVMRTLDAFTAQAKSCDVDLSIEQGSDVPPAISMDAEKVAWALATLVGNALRFVQNKKGAHIKVQLAWNAEAHELVIRVRDNGPGMPEHRSRFLFERDPASGQSAGLALLMVRDVLVAHRGRIEVTSVLGQGTTFTMFIPRQGSSS